MIRPMSPHSCKSNHLSFIESHCSWKKIRPSQTKVRIVCLKILRERQIRRDPWIQIRAIFIAFRSGSRKRVRIIKSISQDFWPSCGPAFANSRSFTSLRLAGAIITDPTEARATFDVAAYPKLVDTRQHPANSWN